MTGHKKKPDLLGIKSSIHHYERDYRSITPTKDNVLVTDMDFGERMSKGGIIMIDDDRKSAGIRPRWCRVLAVGRLQKDVKVGEWILVSHGRWTRGMDYTDADGNSINIRLVDPKDILMATDQRPESDDTINTEAV
jgi:co-chaperonin GroES (HSP10)